MERQDFCGFTFNGIHSSELHIVRTSDGDRYKETLIPSFSTETVKISGSDNTLAWNSFYNQKDFEINIAFDNLSERDFRNLREIFSAKARGWLIFDETPYKKYDVVISQPPELEYICFDENVDVGKDWITHDELYYRNDPHVYSRIYKGEGTINFICYESYAQNVWTFIEEIPVDKYLNTREWIGASGLHWKVMKKNNNLIPSSYIISDQEYCSPYTDSSPYYYVYNPGDRPADWICAFNNSESTQMVGKIVLQEYIDDQWISTKQIVFTDSFSNLLLKEGYKVVYDSKKHLLELKNKANTTETLLNKYIKSGDFFTIPLGQSRIVFLSNNKVNIQEAFQPDLTSAQEPELTFYYY